MKNSLSIKPYGGLKEIGSNLCVFNGGSENIIIDAGILFPYEECFNLDYLIPDLSEIDPSITNHIVFTHGHEDHIGAVYHIIEKFPNIQIWASKFTAKLIQRKLGFYKISCPVRIFDEEKVLKFKDIELHPVHVNHSIPETFGFVIQDHKKSWSVFWASDFKIDEQTQYEPAFNFAKAKELLNQTPHQIAMLDSTNILSPNKAYSEFELIQGIDEIIQEAPSRLFLTQFSSNIHRMQTILNSCHKHGKKLIPVGRSMEFYLSTAEEVGILEVPPKTLKNIKEVDFNNRNNVFLVAGCQGDFFSSLKRIVFGEYKDIHLKPEDTVAFSSKVIPGNEKTIFRMYNKIIEAGAHLITAKNTLIHASGHPGQKDLHQVLTDLPFTDHLPIHGESLFLKRHQEFVQTHYPKIKSHIALNFDTIELKTNGDVNVIQGENLAPILIHGQGVEIERSQISQRRKVAQNGLAIISVASSQVRINLLGLPVFCDEHIDHLESLLRNHYRKHLKKRKPDFIEQELAHKLRRYFKELIGYKPSCQILLNG